MNRFLPVVVLLAASFVAFTYGFPGVGRDDASASAESDEKKNVDTVLILPPGSRNRFGRPVMDLPDISDMDDTSMEEYPSYFNPFMSNPFDGFLTRMQDFMTRFREQMAGILSRIPDDAVSPWGKIPEGANTTSTTKIIDGHVVTVNESVFTDGDDSHGMVFRVRVIDIKPQNETVLPTGGEGVDTTTQAAIDGEKEETTPTRSIETVEDLDNEIPKNQGELTA